MRTEAPIARKKPRLIKLFRRSPESHPARRLRRATGLARSVIRREFPVGDEARRSGLARWRGPNGTARSTERREHDPVDESLRRVPVRDLEGLVAELRDAGQVERAGT